MGFHVRAAPGGVITKLKQNFQEKVFPLGSHLKKPLGSYQQQGQTFISLKKEKATTLILMISYIKMHVWNYC